VPGVWMRVTAREPFAAAAYDVDSCGPSTEFWYYVLARKDAGGSDWSTEVSAVSVPAL
jgi:hypothetical protein